MFENDLYGPHVRLSVFNFFQFLTGVVISQVYFILQANKVELKVIESMKQELAKLQVRRDLTQEEIERRDTLRQDLAWGKRPPIGFSEVLGSYVFKDWFFTVVPALGSAIIFVKLGLRSTRVVQRIDIVPSSNSVRFWLPNSLLGRKLKPVHVNIDHFPRVERVPPIEDALFTVQPKNRKWKYMIDQRNAKFKNRDVLMRVLCGRGLKMSHQQSMNKLKSLGYKVQEKS